MNKIKPFWPNVLLIVFSAALIFGVLNTGHDWGGDFASYIMQAKALVGGTTAEFMQANRFTIEHTTRAFAPVAYPWGYPAMLAPVYAGFGENMIALKWVAASCFILLLVSVAIVFRKQHPGAWLIGLVGLIAVNPTLLQFLNLVNSDIPFLLVSTVGVCLIGRYAVRRRYFISPAWDGIGLGLLIVFASTLRTNGILLLATLFLTQLVAYGVNARRDGEKPGRGPGLLVHGLPYMVFFAVMFLVKLSLPSGEESHMDYLRLMTPGGIKYHVTYYGFLTQDLFEGVPYPLAVYLLTLPLAVLGMARRRREDYFIIIYLLMTYVLYVLWPITQPVRFLFPIFPFYLSFTLTGLQALQGNASHSPSRLRQALSFLPVLFIFVCFSLQSIGQARDNLVRDRQPPVGPYTPAAVEMFAFIKESTEPDSVVVFRKPRVMRMFTNRQAYSASDPDGLDLADYLVRFVHDQKRQIKPEHTQAMIDRGRLETVFENSGFYIYQVRHVGIEVESDAGDPTSLTPD